MSKLDLTKLPHLDIVEMPSDPNGYLGHFRATLRGTYNHNRSNQAAIELIRDTLEHLLGILNSAEVAPESENPVEAPAPSVVEQQTSKAPAKTKASKRAAQR